MMLLGERVRCLRKDQDLTQTAFGERLGISRSVVKNLERGMLVNKNSVLPLVKLIAKTFDVSEEWLLYGEDSSPVYIPAAERSVVFLQNQGATPVEATAIAAYLSLDRSQREHVAALFATVLDEINSAMLSI